MSLLERMWDRFVRPAYRQHLKVTFWLERHVAYGLFPIIKRLAPGTREAWMQLDTMQTFFLYERPILAIFRGDALKINLEGPLYECGNNTYPLGAQIFVAHAGWISLGPIDANDLHRQIRKAIDDATFRWLSEAGKLTLATPCREPRYRAVDDDIALRQMAAAAGSRPIELDTGDV